jgi:hypothetical protein
MLCLCDSERRRFPGIALGRTEFRAAYLLPIAWMAALVAVFEPGLIRAEINSAGATAPPCPLARDQGARLRSCEEARPNAAQGARPAATWRLVRASNPRGGPDAVSIMQTADAARSDIDLVRLRLRCSDTGFDVLVVFRKPFPPRAHPKVKATVISPGAAVSLPAEAAMLVKGSWQSSSELAIEVEDESQQCRASFRS